MAAAESTPQPNAPSPHSDGQWADTLPQVGEDRERGLLLSVGLEQPPANLPGYRVLRLLGEGKYGSVWLAREQNTGKQVAIKFYARRRGVDWALLSREVEKLAVLYTSRSIVGLISVGWDHDPPYYVMEYLENGSLATLLDQGPLRVPATVAMATQIAQGLVHAHGSGILHCDLKPANVLLDQNMEPRLCDFGQSRLADEQSHALGTLFYMAPEQADLKGIPDARWDVYALGAIIYHMLVGEPPYRSEQAEQRLHAAGSLEDRLATYQQLVRNSPRAAAHRQLREVDQSLAEIIDRCLARDPAKRFPNAQAVLDKLNDRRQARGRRPWVVLGFVLPLLLVACSVPFAIEAIRLAVTTARSQLTGRALESEVVSVGLLARSMERELLERQRDLERIAELPKVREFVEEFAKQPREKRFPLKELLSDLKYDVDQRHRTDARLLDASWFLNDRSGYQRWREPESMTTLDERFTHRDYFHGMNKDLQPQQVTEAIRPISKPHVSTVYNSTTTGKYSVAISVPVWNADQTEVIGVLARTIYLSQLLVEYEELLQDQVADGVSRVLALIDSRDWKVIAHPWMTEAHLKSVQVEDFSRFRVDRQQAEQLQLMIDTVTTGYDQGKFDRMVDYADPISIEDQNRYGGKWLAAFRPVGDTGWIAVVQERRDEVEKPVEEMRQRMLGYVAGAVGLAVLTLAGTWWLLVSATNENRTRLFRYRRQTKNSLRDDPQSTTNYKSGHATIDRMLSSKGTDS